MANEEITKGAPNTELKNKLDLKSLVDMVNIADDMDEEDLNNIGHWVVSEYEADEESRSEWKERIAEATKMAQMTIEPRDFPWPKSANIKYPLLVDGAIQFAARAYPNIVQGDSIVKGKVYGDDPDGLKSKAAERLGEHMSYQILEEMGDWTGDMDKLLTIFPIIGTAFKKTYRDPIEDRNCSEYCPAEDVVIDYYAKSMEKAPRITHVHEMARHEILERIRGGVYLSVELGEPEGHEKEDSTEEQQGKQFIVLEQHRRLDLDGDGYPEPYIVFVHRKTEKVLRIVARFDEDGIKYNKKGDVVTIKPVEYFTRFIFIPSHDGSIYGIGYGHLIAHLNEAVNSALNQLTNAATLKNAGGGYYDQNRVQFNKKVLTFVPGQYHPLDIEARNINEVLWDRNTSEPSMVSLELLVKLIDAGEKVMSSSGLLSGQMPTGNTQVGTTLALIEQGLKLFTAIYERIHRSLREEFKKIHRLNKLYMPDEYSFRNNSDVVYTVNRSDYESDDIEPVPVSNPKTVTDAQRLLAAQSLLEQRGTGMNDNEINKRFLEALRIPESEKLLPDENQQPAPDPELIIKEHEMALKEREIAIKERQLAISFIETKTAVSKNEAEIVKLRAEAIRAIADAEAKEAGTQIDEYRAQVETEIQRIQQENEGLKSVLSELDQFLGEQQQPTTEPQPEMQPQPQI